MKFYASLPHFSVTIFSRLCLLSKALKNTGLKAVNLAVNSAKSKPIYSGESIGAPFTKTMFYNSHNSTVFYSDIGAQFTLLLFENR